MISNALSLSPSTSSKLSAEQTLLQTRRPAPLIEPTEQRIAIAKKLLLTPFGLTEAHLAKALNEIKAHKVDDADLYFQYTRSEGWSLEEGIVKTGSFSIDQCVGLWHGRVFQLFLAIALWRCCPASRSGRHRSTGSDSTPPFL